MEKRVLTRSRVVSTVFRDVRVAPSFVCNCSLHVAGSRFELDVIITTYGTTQRVYLALQLPRLRLGPRKPPLGEGNLKICESCPSPWSVSKLTCVLLPRSLETRVHILSEFPLDTTISLQIPSTPDSDRHIQPQQRVTGSGRSFLELTD